MKFVNSYDYPIEAFKTAITVPSHHVTMDEYLAELLGRMSVMENSIAELKDRIERFDKWLANAD